MVEELLDFDEKQGVGEEKGKDVVLEAVGKVSKCGLLK